MRILCLLMFATNVYAQPYTTYQGIVLDDEIDYNYVKTVKRNPDGSFYRSARVDRAFKKLHPCPATLLSTGPCPGWQVNHKVPEACGGADTVTNREWMPYDVKHCSGAHCVDSYERKINALTPPIPDTPACVNRIVP